MLDFVRVLLRWWQRGFFDMLQLHVLLWLGWRLELLVATEPSRILDVFVLGIFDLAIPRSHVLVILVDLLLHDVLGPVDIRQQYLFLHFLHRSRHSRQSLPLFDLLLHELGDWKVDFHGRLFVANHRACLAGRRAAARGGFALVLLAGAQAPATAPAAAQKEAKQNGADDGADDCVVVVGGTVVHGPRDRVERRGRRDDRRRGRATEGDHELVGPEAHLAQVVLLLQPEWLPVFNAGRWDVGVGALAAVHPLAAHEALAAELVEAQAEPQRELLQRSQALRATPKVLDELEVLVVVHPAVRAVKLAQRFVAHVVVDFVVHVGDLRARGSCQNGECDQQRHHDA
mmetsp:Transcript_17336/g.48861  ORF Transcript_17336/g.48861 Transcript_17336/m.48861 type:complete len:343 (+) Transcript_17336:1708-2736(+)